MDPLKEIIIQIELHSIQGIRDCFTHGINPNFLFNGEPLIYELISEYTRSPRFKECVNAFVDQGLIFDDDVLLAVLCDDASTLNQRLIELPGAIFRRYTLRSAYTPFHEAHLLHICAEFNHVSCAEVLIRHGTSVDVKAGVDEYEFGGQTPIFHTINQNANQSADMFRLFLSHSPDLQITVPGLIWGKGYSWETLIPAVNPISYAMMGLLPQMHRDEKTISERLMLKQGYGIDYVMRNVPCAYLTPNLLKGA